MTNSSNQLTNENDNSNYSDQRPYFYTWDHNKIPKNTFPYSRGGGYVNADWHELDKQAHYNALIDTIVEQYVKPYIRYQELDNA